jgi:hypothetical protein
MSLYPEVHESVEGNTTNFLQKFLYQLEIQSGATETKDVSGSHPDLLIRNCLKGLLFFLTSNSDSKLSEVIGGLSQTRKHIDATHLADLIARSVQYLFRQQKDNSYLLFTAQQWELYFSSLTADKVKKLEGILTNKEVATHVLARYRSLAALDFQYFQQVAEPLRVADIGCSLNFGLRASVKGKILQTDLDTLTDMTSDQVILNSLKSRKPPIEYALGVDIQEPDFEWVAACAYFSKYDDNRKTLQKYRDLIENDIHNGVPIHGLVGDISNDETVKKIQANQMRDFHIMYGSMVFYQLSPEMQLRAFHNVSTLLAENGVLAELTFKNPNNWFLPWNTATTLRFKENGALTRPLQWLDWDSSRCSVVKEGADFQESNLRLANL